MKKVSLKIATYALIAASLLWIGYRVAFNNRQAPEPEERLTQQKGVTTSNSVAEFEKEWGPAETKRVDENGTVIHTASAEAPFTTGIWQVEVWADLKDINAGNKGEGMWFKFELDGTFTSGLWDTQNRTGKWRLIEDRQTLEFVYDDKPDRIYGYRYQGQGESMVFIGLGTYRTNGVQIKLNREQDYPRK